MHKSVLWAFLSQAPGIGQDEKDYSLKTHHKVEGNARHLCSVGICSCVRQVLKLNKESDFYYDGQIG